MGCQVLSVHYQKCESSAFWELGITGYPVSILTCRDHLEVAVMEHLRVSGENKLTIRFAERY